MRKLKITPGEWVSKKSNHYSGYHVQQKDDDVTIANVIGYPKQTQANSDFIAEAGTVANETGLMPREMKEQRDRLLSLLKEHYSDFVGEGNNSVSDLGKRTKEAIAAVEGRE